MVLMGQVLGKESPTNTKTETYQNFYWSMQNLVQKVPILYESNPKKNPKATDSNNIISRASSNDKSRDALADPISLLYERNKAGNNHSWGNT